jgi:hypothetical protein
MWITIMQPSACPQEKPYKAVVDNLHLINSVLQNRRLKLWYSTLEKDFKHLTSFHSYVREKFPGPEKIMYEACELEKRIARTSGILDNIR